MQWLERRDFDLKVDAFLRQISVLYLVSLHPAL